MPEANAPVLPAYIQNDRAIVWCSFCFCWHSHSNESGYREAHCKLDTPYAKVGYILEIKGPVERTIRKAKPIKGQCPDGYPIKATKEGFYYTLASDGYYDVRADVCFARERDAMAAEYLPIEQKRTGRTWITYPDGSIEEF